MRPFRAISAGLFVLALAAPAAVSLPSPATAAPPVVTDDHKWMFPNQGRSIDVLANDSDPDGDDLAVCRVDVPDGADYFAAPDGDRLVVFTGEDPGHDIVIDYYVCDYETLVPATLTISFRELHPMKVVKLDRPGRLRVRNDNVRAVRFLYGDFDEERPDGRVRIEPESSVVIRVHRHRIDWIAFMARNGLLIGIGHVRGIELPAREVVSGRSTVTLTDREARLWAKQR